LELLIVVLVFGIFIGAVCQTSLIGLRTVTAADTREALRQQVAHALDRLAREALTAQAVVQAQDQWFMFESDLNGDGLIDATTEQDISFRLIGTDLMRSLGDVPTGVALVRDVSSLDFDYEDLTGAAWDGVDPLDIRVVKITLTATAAAEVVSMASSIYLRNM
jgi:type II secretory pathway pseudopilin PulG